LPIALRRRHEFEPFTVPERIGDDIPADRAPDVVRGTAGPLIMAIRPQFPGTARADQAPITV
jgi:hypothetical protein